MKRRLCPFCRSEATNEDVSTMAADPMAAVCCPGCGAKGPTVAGPDCYIMADAAWNHRDDQEDLRQHLRDACDGSIITLPHPDQGNHGGCTLMPSSFEYEGAWVTPRHVLSRFAQEVALVREQVVAERKRAADAEGKVAGLAADLDRMAERCRLAEERASVCQKENPTDVQAWIDWVDVAGGQWATMDDVLTIGGEDVITWVAATLRSHLGIVTPEALESAAAAIYIRFIRPAMKPPNG